MRMLGGVVLMGALMGCMAQTPATDTQGSMEMVEDTVPQPEFVQRTKLRVTTCEQAGAALGDLIAHMVLVPPEPREGGLECGWFGSGDDMGGRLFSVSIVFGDRLVRPIPDPRFSPVSSAEIAQRQGVSQIDASTRADGQVWVDFRVMLPDAEVVLLNGGRASAARSPMLDEKRALEVLEKLIQL
jgi:hypothetical protein